MECGEAVFILNARVASVLLNHIRNDADHVTLARHQQRRVPAHVFVLLNVTVSAVLK